MPRAERQRWTRNLLLAAACGDVRGVREALRSGADPNAVDRDGETALTLAARSKVPPAVLLALQQAGAVLDKPNRASQTPLMVASAAGRLGLVRALNGLGARIDRVNRQGESALTYAIVWNRARIVRELLTYGASANTPRPPSWTPLMYAAQEGHAGVVRLLLAYGAAPNAKDRYGRSAADIAEAYGHTRLAAELGKRATVASQHGSSRSSGRPRRAAE